MTEREIIALLVAALTSAESHLDYVGWGDRWERECAHEQGLPSKISDALNVGRNYLEAP